METSQWSEWSKHVLLELKRQDRNHEKILKEFSELDEKFTEKFQKLHVDIISLKTKSAVWGSLAGTIVASIVSGAIALAFGGKP